MIWQTSQNKSATTSSRPMHRSRTGQKVWCVQVWQRSDRSSMTEWWLTLRNLSHSCALIKLSSRGVHQGLATPSQLSVVIVCTEGRLREHKLWFRREVFDMGKAQWESKGILLVIVIVDVIFFLFSFGVVGRIITHCSSTTVEYICHCLFFATGTTGTARMECFGLWTFSHS